MLGFWWKRCWRCKDKQEALVLGVGFLQAEQKKRATIISAEGDAVGAQMLADAFGKAGEALVQLRKLEAAEDIAYQLSKAKSVIYLPSNQQALISLPQ